jgi:hypothetical protein
MKKLSQILLLILLLIAYAEKLYTQDEQKSIIVSPLIGDTLTIEERNYYNLFPKMDGFQWAVFYINPDSSLRAKVTYIEDIDYKEYILKRYRTLESFQEYLYEVKNTKIDRNENGIEVVAQLNNGNEISGNLLSIRGTSLLVYSPEWGMDDDVLNIDYISNVKQNEIQKLTIVGKSNVLKGMGIGLLVGIGVGALVGVAANSGGTGLAKGLAAGAAGLGVGVVCFLVGTIVGITSSTPDEVIEPFSGYDIKGLSIYSRYPVEEPEELNNFK